MKSAGGRKEAQLTKGPIRETKEPQWGSGGGKTAASPSMNGAVTPGPVDTPSKSFFNTALPLEHAHNLL